MECNIAGISYSPLLENKEGGGGSEMILCLFRIGEPF